MVGTHGPKLTLKSNSISLHGLEPNQELDLMSLKGFLHGLNYKVKSSQTFWGKNHYVKIMKTGI